MKGGQRPELDQGRRSLSIEGKSLGGSSYNLDHRCRLQEKQSRLGDNCELCRSCTFAQTLTPQWKQGIPIEVVPFAYAKVLHNLAELGSPSVMPDGKPGLSLRMGKMKAGPVVSDNGMFIIDAPFPEHLMKNPADVSRTFIKDEFCS